MNLGKKQGMRSVMAMLVMIAMVMTSMPTLNVKAKSNNETISWGDDYKVTVSTPSQWYNGYNANITITNTSDHVIHNWHLAFCLADDITDIWNAQVVSNEDGIYVIKNDVMNQDIPIGESISFGFTASNALDVNLPTSYFMPTGTATIDESMYQVNYALKENWEMGFTACLEIANKSENDFTDWTLEFDYDNKNQTFWEATLTTEEISHIILNNLNYNQNIRKGESLTLDFIGYPGDETLNPCNFKLTQITFNEGMFDDDIDKDGLVNKDELMKGTNPYDADTDDDGVDDGTEILHGLDPLNPYTHEGIPDSEYVKISKAKLDELNIENKTIYSDVFINNRISVSVENLTSDKEYSVNIYQWENEKWELIGELLDNGNLSRNRDEIKNDGVFSNIIPFNQSEIGMLNIKCVLIENGKEIDSKEDKIEIIRSLGNEDINDYKNSIFMIESYFSNYMIENNMKNQLDITKVIEDLNMFLSDNSNIKDIKGISSTCIEVVFQNNLSLLIQFTDESNMEIMKRGDNTALDTISELDNDLFIDVDEEIPNFDYVLSKDVLVWAPFDSEWGDDDEVDTIKEFMNESITQNMLTVLSDNKADVNSLKELDQYGLIILSTHGINGEWIVTGEHVKQKNAYREELASGQISVFMKVNVDSNTTEEYYMVHDKFFKNHKSKLPNSIIINNSCESIKTNALWKAFEGMGAKTYYGYTGAVTNDYVINQTSSLLLGLLLEGKTTEEAYSYTFDSYYDEGEFMLIKGVSNLKIPICLVNNDFERGLLGWNKDGDGRVITKLGDVMPTSGERMAIISTGLGYTLERGSISQKMYIPEDAKQLNFDWNFISEEFLECIGSEFDDPFHMSIILCDELNTEKTLLDLDVNKIASQFGANSDNGGNLIRVSPNVTFGIRDVWMTDWQAMEFDISEYAGQVVTIKFSVQAAKDSIHTTAVLIDNVQLDVNYESGSIPEYVSDDYADSVIRGKYKENTTGRSYILYRPDDPDLDEGQFSDQAPKLRKTLKYQNGYKDLEQVGIYPIRTEKEFIDAWNGMSPGEKNGKIDNVYLIFHGSYYALIIDPRGDKNEYLTTSPESKTSYDNNATYIRDNKKLNKKSIKSINIIACNTGLLDAINLDYIKKVDNKEGFVIKGNVAQAFLESQDVDSVEAWDGSVSFVRKTGLPRESRIQGSISGFLKDLKDVRKFIPYRKKAILKDYIERVGSTDLHLMPNGKVIYYRKEPKMYVSYNYLAEIPHPAYYPIMLPTYYSKNIKLAIGLY